MSGHSDSGTCSSVEASSILTWVCADPVSLACPAHPGRLAITSRTFAVIICDADEPCSVNTTMEPESSSTTSPRSTTRPFHVHGWKEFPLTVCTQPLPAWSFLPSTFHQDFVELSPPKHSCQRVSQQTPFQRKHCLNCVPPSSPPGPRWTKPNGWGSPTSEVGAMLERPPSCLGWTRRLRRVACPAHPGSLEITSRTFVAV